MPRQKAFRCKRGHEFTPENTILKPNGKACRICRNANARIRYNADPELRARILADNIARARRNRLAARNLSGGENENSRNAGS